jgi:alanine racemase
VTALTRALIDRAALRANLATLRAAARGSRIMAVVKANAYGHGLVEVAEALEGADAFAVARLEEALTLRAAGIARPVVLLEGVFSAAQLESAAGADLELVVHDPEQVRLLESYRGHHRFVLWLKVNTGMNSLGFRVEASAAIERRLRAVVPAPREIRLMTHLARADEPDSGMTLEQVARFHELVGAMRGPAQAGPVTSIGNSAGMLGWPDARGDWVRPGLALYGASPLRSRTAAALGLVPVMSLETTVIALRDVPRGESVGYGAGWHAPRDSRIAILAAGYADGLPRHLPNGTPIRLACGTGSLAGRISMDMCAVDVTELREARVGDRAVLWGPGSPVEELAERAGTIAYELLCGVAPRVGRELRG